MIDSLLNHFRIPRELIALEMLGEGSATPGYFRFGDQVLFGRTSFGKPRQVANDALEDVQIAVELAASTCYVPFNVDEVITNLREERYASDSAKGVATNRIARRVYYLIRPLLGVAVRKHLQRFALRHALEQPFPCWPVDRTVERTFAKLLHLVMKSRGVERLPFIWFWPDGQSGCALMTHDVETRKGLAFCSQLMDLDNSQAIKSAFQIVPAERYVTPREMLEEIQERGFEVNVHDWNHDGRLYSDRSVFLERVRKINEAGQSFGAKGFRSGGLYRNSRWYDSLAFEYDMSIPNVAHLDPQPGGCCTVMPYFIGDILEIPVTTIQDYSLLHISRRDPINLWKEQIDLILQCNGMASFIVHPDYIVEPRARDVYAQLLTHLAWLRASRNVWIARPQDVNRWWRERNRLRLVRQSDGWRIQGEGKERARLAYAIADETSLSFALD